MKRISTLLASLVLSIAVFAAPRPKNSLTIQSVDNSDIRVIVDGRRFEPNDNSIRISGLETGTHKVKIYKARNNGMFTIYNKRYEVVFNGSVAIRPRSNMNILIDRYGRATINDNRGNNGRGNQNYGDRDDEFDFERGNNSGDYGSDRGGSWGDYDQHDGYSSAMSDREFRQVLESIDKEWLESNKIKSASHIVTSNQMTSAQVKQIAQLFSFENNKLEVAKKAYQSTIDKRNYTMIMDVFSFNSSKEELARFIRNFR
jgi:hypothetical protein